MSDVNWYYLEGSTPTGPFTWSRLIEFSKAGIIGPTTYVWAEGTNDWVAFSDVVSQVPWSMPPLPRATAAEHEALYTVAPVAETVAADSASSSWITAPPAPWRRYGARLLDTSIHGFLGFFLLGFTWYALAPVSADKAFSFLATPAGTFVDLVLTVLMAAFIGGFVVGATGSSIGKAIFGIRVVDSSAQAIGVAGGLSREFRVWFFGLGLGIPIVALIAMIFAYKRLNDRGVTSWDEGRHVVMYRPNGTLQYAMNALGAVLIVVLFVLIKALNRA